jgi:hypothetical protein
LVIYMLMDNLLKQLNYQQMPVMVDYKTYMVLHILYDLFKQMYTNINFNNLHLCIF